MNVDAKIAKLNSNLAKLRGKHGAPVASKPAKPKADPTLVAMATAEIERQQAEADAKAKKKAEFFAERERQTAALEAIAKSTATTL